MVKAHSTFTIDHEILDKARQAGLNLSECAEDGLRRALTARGMDVKDIDEIKHEQGKKERKVQEKKVLEQEGIQKAYASGHLVVDEHTPSFISIRKMY